MNRSKSDDRPKLKFLSYLNYLQKILYHILYAAEHSRTNLRIYNNESNVLNVGAELFYIDYYNGQGF